ncbi:hypothetical protein VNO80_21450 [Phaseolus coccineus]|uniref:Uncharacterized protein n=1 Tax=Phaseolus coccineus TaxID=3886 RepID=A0AAN9QU37_PHACN
MLESGGWWWRRFDWRRFQGSGTKEAAALEPERSSKEAPERRMATYSHIRQRMSSLATMDGSPRYSSSRLLAEAETRRSKWTSPTKFSSCTVVLRKAVVGMMVKFFELDINYIFQGLIFSSKTINDNLSSKVKPAAMKGSTLMKPTASQLAKQNRLHQIVSSRPKNAAEAEVVTGAAPRFKTCPLNRKIGTCYV